MVLKLFQNENQYRFMLFIVFCTDILSLVNFYWTGTLIRSEIEQSLTQEVFKVTGVTGGIPKNYID